MNAIDVHNHWYPEQWVELLRTEGAANGAAIGANERGQLTFKVPGIPFVAKRSYCDLDLRFKAMDAARVAMHVLSLTNPMVNWAPPAFGLRLAQVWNDQCSAAVTQHPDRLAGLVTVPLQAPELAVRELERAARLPGMRGVCIASTINGRNLDEAEFFPFYAKCEALGLPVFLHPLANPVGVERMPRHYFPVLLGIPTDTALAAASLVFGGVMDAFPGLEVVLAHAGGSFPALIGRMDHGAKVRPEVKITNPPSSYLRRFYYDTISHNDELLANLIRQVGADRIVLGSDHPSDMSYTRPVDVVERLDAVPARERDMILGGNAARLFKL